MQGRPAQIRKILVCIALPALIGTCFFVVWSVLDGFGRGKGGTGDPDRDHRLRVFANDAPPPDSIVFMGSSTIEFWDLSRSFPQSPVVNRGIGGEPIGALLDRLDAPGVLPRDTAGVVLYVGSVDFNTHGRPWEEVAAGVETVLSEVRRRRPRLPILVIPINPARDTTASRVKALAALTKHVRDHAASLDPVVHVIETDAAPLRAVSGALAEGASADNWHLNEVGYAELARRLTETAERVGFPLR